VGRGRGGDDTEKNTEIRCHECHFRFEHSPKVIARKR
jgi:DNA-directed RNA polymerase subunit RPC12/RpoP